jgi:phage terminase small subunit
MQKLSAKQEQFCREYLVDLNATQAAIRAGYSPKTANRIASENLSKPDIMERVALLQRQRAEKTERTAKDALNDLFLYTREAHEMGDLKTAMKGIELQLKHFGELTDKVKQELTGANGGPIDNQLTIRLVRPNHADR